MRSAVAGSSTGADSVTLARALLNWGCELDAFDSAGARSASLDREDTLDDLIVDSLICWMRDLLAESSFFFVLFVLINLSSLCLTVELNPLSVMGKFV